MKVYVLIGVKLYVCLWIFIFFKIMVKILVLLIICNKKVQFDFELLEKVEVGIVLMGSEVKSLWVGKVLFEEVYVLICGNEVIFKGCNIQLYKYVMINVYELMCECKLLMYC